MDKNLQRFFAEYPLETLLQTIPTGLFLVDIERNVAYWNAEAERITGYSAAEAVGRHCSFLEGIPCTKKCGLFMETIKKPVIGISCSVQHKDGHRVELNKNFDLLRDDQGQVIGGIEAFVDISRQKELESSLRSAVDERTRELQLEKASLRSVLDGMTDPVYICNAAYEITFLNRAMHDLFGDIEGRLCYRVLYDEDSVCCDCPLSAVLHGEVVQRDRYLQKNGCEYEVMHTPFPLSDKPTHKLAVFRDITNRKAAERQLKQVNRELDAFVSTVSHDLRSPLTPLVGFAEILEDRYKDQLDDLGRDCLTEIKQTAGRMTVLLEDLLTLARVGQLKLPEQQQNVSDIVEDVLLELADKVLERHARVQIASLPKIRIPESLLFDLFRNLLGNALKYAARSNPQIEVRGQQFPGRVRYEVVDHGPGVPADEREVIFEPFKRGSSSSGLSGTGIGLATVAKIARVYQGDAWVEETPGGGATFIVELTDPAGR
ncbi:MAG TPA: ATP-binding protein [Malonomonas sp.]